MSCNLALTCPHVCLGSTRTFADRPRCLQWISHSIRPLVSPTARAAIVPRRVPPSSDHWSLPASPPTTHSSSHEQPSQNACPCPDSLRAFNFWWAPPAFAVAFAVAFAFKCHWSVSRNGRFVFLPHRSRLSYWKDLGFANLRSWTDTQNARCKRRADEIFPPCNPPKRKHFSKCVTSFNLQSFTDGTL